MADTLLSVGLDIGTTTTQMIVSRLEVANQATGFAVPRLEITARQILYRSPVCFTPLVDGKRVDEQAIREWVSEQYRQAGISRNQVRTGAVIITGETSRKENAEAVLRALSDFAGDFVVATAGPDLESVLAAKGAGAVHYSEETGKTVLHMDIGGGTSNLALIQEGRIRETGCLNVGGRLVKWDDTGNISYISPVLQGLTDLTTGRPGTPEQIQDLVNILVQVLEMAAGRRERTPLLNHFLTQETGKDWQVPQVPAMLSFSGGVADCIEAEDGSNHFGDIGSILGSAIRKSRLCQGTYMLGKETIRATVIGAGCHSTQLSGSTVFCQNVPLPLKNLPVIAFTFQEQEAQDFPQRIARRLQEADSPEAVLALPGYAAPTYASVTALAEKIAAGVAGEAVYVCLEADMAKALGQRLSLVLPPNTPCLCLDRVALAPESYLDVALPIGPALPVVVKTLILGQ